MQPFSRHVCHRARKIILCFAFFSLSFTLRSLTLFIFAAWTCTCTCTSRAIKPTVRLRHSLTNPITIDRARISDLTMLCSRASCERGLPLRASITFSRSSLRLLNSSARRRTQLRQRLLEPRTGMLSRRCPPPPPPLAHSLSESTDAASRACACLLAMVLLPLPLHCSCICHTREILARLDSSTTMSTAHPPCCTIL
jgi:hypothetical protein